MAGRADRRAENMDPIPETNPEKVEKAEKSYFSAAVESVTPWTGFTRSSTPKPAAFTGEASGLKNQHGGFQSTYQVVPAKYPSDCPPTNAKWFYAVDIPKWKPKLLMKEGEDSKPTPPPKKFVTFSDDDSRAIEAAYQKLAGSSDEQSKETQPDDNSDIGVRLPDTGKKQSQGTNETGRDESSSGRIKVPVQEDYLFDVDVERRELLPVYWLGPIYEVRRGSWFYQEGSTLRPCDENLATQLEEGYLKIKPFRYPKLPEKSQKSNDQKLGVGGNRSRASSTEVTPKASVENLRTANQQALDEAASGPAASTPHQPQTYRLFGTYMNSVVTYQDSTVAWISADSIMSRVSSTVYQKFAGGGYLGGVKIVRGYTEPGKPKDPLTADKSGQPPNTGGLRPPNLPPVLQQDERQQKLLKRRSAPPTTAHPEKAEKAEKIEKAEPEPEGALSSLPTELDPELEAEAARKRDEKEIQNDYKGREGEDQGREIEHLILVTHGIGEKIGRMNFVHNVNVFRKTLKSVYSSSADLQALNSEIDKLPKNCKVQVLPVCWRHLLDFPRKGARQNRKEHDLGEAYGDEDEYPSLEDITIEGIPFVRSLVTDLALDILLYQSAYREHISRIVTDESNRIFDLFVQRNPYFKGKVSLAGHSLGSAVLFDILCRQKDEPKRSNSNAHKRHQKNRPSTGMKPQSVDLDFDFNVEHFYCMGSPIGIFQMLKSRTIAGRHQPDAMPAESPMDPDYLHDPFVGAFSHSAFSIGDNISTKTGLPLTVSSPKCAQLYNIIHPADPIAFRLEPLIAPAMSSMKPQALPYTKKTMAASVSGIGAKVGQSVSGLWSSLSSGIASSLLNRSLGLTNDDIARMEAPGHATRSRNGSQTQQQPPPQATGGGTNISGGGVIQDSSSMQREMNDEKKKQLAEDTAAADRDGSRAKAATLIDDDIETLYDGFQKRRKDKDAQNDHDEAEERGKKLRREEMKVRALNQNGRVDFCIQESVLDFNPINTMASHLAYWADEDVSHFMMSQLLSTHRMFSRADKNPLK